MDRPNLKDAITDFETLKTGEKYIIQAKVNGKWEEPEIKYYLNKSLTGRHAPTLVFGYTENDQIGVSYNTKKIRVWNIFL